MNITTKDIRLYNLSLQIAELSNCAARHGSVIANGSSIISVGMNKKRTHPIAYKHLGFQFHTTHSEMIAIIKAHRDISGMCIINAKANGNQKSKPCPMCRSLLIEAGIKTIVYFDGKELVKERL